MRHPRLSVCLIVRDEAANLARCLSSVQEVADQIVVVDTGSVDGTPELARRLGAQVDFFPWTESFSEARNRSLELARGEWVLVLDADEELLAEDGPRLLECIHQEGVEAYFLQTLNLAGERSAEAVFRHPVLRLFRNRAEYRYQGRIHETVLPAILARAGREAIRVAPVRIRHYGYLKRTVQEKDKARRNLGLLLKEKEERPADSFLYYNLGVEYLRLGEYRTALDCFDRAEAGLDWRSAFAPSLVLKKADCLRAMGRVEEALAYLERCYRTYPDFTDLYYQVGLLRLEQGNFSGAAEAFRRCLLLGEPPRHYPSQEGVGGSLALTALGQVYEDRLQEEEALSFYCQALAANPRDLRPLAAIIRLLLAGHSEEEAVAYLDAHFDLTTPLANLEVAELFLSFRRPQAALQFLAAAKRLGADNDRYRCLAGEAQLLAGDLEEAGRLLEEIPRSSPFSLRAAVDRFLLYLAAGDRCRAEAVAGEIDGPGRAFLLGLLQGEPPALGPEVTSLWLDLLEKSLALGDLPLAEILLDAAREPTCLLAAGKALYRAGHPGRARKLLEDGLAAGEPDAEAALLLARIAREEGDYEAASSAYARALEWEPNYPKVYAEAVAFYRELAASLLADLTGAALMRAALMAPRPRLSLCMIVRDEEASLPRCLNSVAEAVDEIVVVDTGSTDNTVRVARWYGARVFSYPWSGDFSAARNFALAQARGDWVLVLDADEELAPGEAARLRSLLRSAEAEAYCLPVVNYLGTAPGADYQTDLVCRLFRNRPGYRFRRALHEQVIDQILAQAGPQAVKIAPIRILHYGYLAPVATAKGKAERNLAIIERELASDPENCYLRYSLGVELLNRGAYREALEEFRRAHRPSAPYTSDLVLKTAVCLQALKCTDRALGLLETAARRWPEFTDLYYLAGEIALEQKEYRRAATAFRRCLDLGDAPPGYCSTAGAGSFRAWFGLGRALEGLGQTEEAEAAYCRALQANPAFHAPLYPLARLLRHRLGPRPAAQQLESFFDLSRPAHRLLLADLLLAVGEYPLALEYLEPLPPSGPEGARAAYLRGWCLAHLGRYAEAESWWRLLPPQSPYYLPALTWRYLLAAKQGRTAEAEKLAEELAARDHKQWQRGRQVAAYAARFPEAGFGELVARLKAPEVGRSLPGQPSSPGLPPPVSAEVEVVAGFLRAAPAPDECS